MTAGKSAARTFAAAEEPQAWLDGYDGWFGRPIGVVIAAAFLLYAQRLTATGLMTIGTFAAYIVAMLQMYDPLRKLSRIRVESGTRCACGSDQTD